MSSANVSLRKIEEYLETNGWTRRVAGKPDFDTTMLAIEQMAVSGRGLIVSGEYGVGKTALAKVVAQAFGGAFKVRLSLAEELERLTIQWQEYHVECPFHRNVLLDDLGAEKPVNDYGIVSELAGDFIVRYHELADEGMRLIVTTNLTTAELDERYGGRVLSRLKDLCVPLRLNGKDKRRWTTNH